VCERYGKVALTGTPWPKNRVAIGPAFPLT
jgi:hypothetical protein